jgi:hypothetical protein
MPSPKHGATSIFEDDKMYDRILHTIAHHFSIPLFEIEQVFRIMKSIDKTIVVLSLAENKKIPAIPFAHQNKEVPYVLPLTREGMSAGPLRR